MEFKQLKIRGTYLVEPKIYEDNRGLFFESFNNKSLKKIIKKKKIYSSQSFIFKKKCPQGNTFPNKKTTISIILFSKGAVRCFFS